MFIKYLELKLSLIPIVKGQKRPVESGWQRYCDRLPTEEEAAEWESRHFSYGLALGPASNVMAIDIDSDEPKVLNACPPSPVRKRGKKGETRFFKYNAEIQSTKVAGCIDVLVKGRQTVLPPSIHPETGKPYSWITPDTLENFEISDLPEFTLDDLREMKHALEPQQEIPTSDPIADPLAGPIHNDDPGRLSPHGSHDRLKKLACSLIAQGVSPDSAVDELLKYDAQMHRPVGYFGDGTRPDCFADPKSNALHFYSSILKTMNRSRTQNGEPPFEPDIPSPLFGQLKPLPGMLPKAPTLEPDLVPEPFRAWVSDAAERMTIGLEFILMPALVALASVVGRQIAVRPKQYDPWWEVMNLWGMIVGPPSVLKSPALTEALSFLNKINKTRAIEYKLECEKAAPKLDILRTKKKGLEAAIKKAAKAETDSSEHEKKLAEIYSEIKASTPVLKRVMLNDTTVEKMCEILSENENGVLIFRDELAGWLSNLTKQGREGDRELFLEAWNGKNSYNVDRIMRGSQFIPALRVAIVGGIQPTKLSLFIKDIVNGGSNADGLFDRFQLAVFPERTDWKFIDRRENTDAKERVRKIFEFLLSADYATNGLETVEGIPALRFSADAQQIFNQWLSDHEAKLRHPSIADTPHFESHLGKYRSLMPKVAALFELIDWADVNQIVHAGIKRPLTRISKGSTELAIRLCAFLEEHAKKIHAIALEPGLVEAQELAKKIKRGEIKNGATIREISRHHWRHLRRVEDVEAGLSILENVEWLKVHRSNIGKPGRPSEVVILHPDLRKPNTVL